MEFYRNRLLAALPREEYRRMSANLEPVLLSPGRVIEEPEQRPDYVYFPADSLVSFVGITRHGARMDVGLVGHEGMTGIAALLGSVVHFAAVVQIPGLAFRLAAPALTAMCRQSERLHSLFLRYIGTVLVEIRQSGVCHRFHSVRQRLCRWLLAVHDRLTSPTLRLTQESLSRMLGIRRAGISEAAVELRRRRLIGYTRGEITIIDRGGLERASCECYELVRAHRLENLFS